MRLRATMAVAAIVAVSMLVLTAGSGCKPAAEEVAAVSEQAGPGEGQPQEAPVGVKPEQASPEEPAELLTPEELLESGELHEQMQAVQSLGQALPLLSKSEAKQAVQALAKVAVDRGRDPEVRRACAYVLARVMDKYSEARDAVSRLAEDEDSEVRLAVAESLEGAPKHPVRTKLLEKLSKDSSAVVRAAAIRVRTQFEARSRQRKAWKQLIARLGQPEGDASAQAAIQIVVKGGENPRPMLKELVSALRQSKDPRQRHAIAMCIAMICAGENPQQEKFGRLARVTKKTAVRLHKAVAEGVEPLVEALQDEDPYVREIAAQGLGYIGDARAAAALGKALSDPVVHVRRRAAAALITVPAKAAQRALEKAARTDPDARVRRYAVEALGWIEDDSVVPTLIAAASDEDSHVRRFAAHELGRRKAREALDALLTLFDDPDEDVRWQAVLAVGKMRDPRATDALVKALDDPTPQVANAAERALQRLGIARRREKYLEGS